MWIEIDGVKYRAKEPLPYHGPGFQACVLATPDGARVAVKRGGTWSWWTKWDRTAPLRNTLSQAKEDPAP